MWDWITIKWMIFVEWGSLIALLLFLYNKLQKNLDNRLDEIKSLIIADNHVIDNKLDLITTNQRKTAEFLNSK